MNRNADDESRMNTPTRIEGPKLTYDRFGNPDQAYLFDGIDDYIMLNNNEALITEKQFTICMWARIIGRSKAEPKYNNSLFEQRNDDPTEGLFESLLGELMKSMGENGPARSINVCKTRAPEISAAVSKETGVRIGRTSFKLRNESVEFGQSMATSLRLFWEELVTKPLP